ncbi:adenylyltransferase and sulfurtransferase MOCS3 isoform X1 [Ostrinia furnacalis]|uniref:adenylyltransferase and sulfurtransferase MOCS3 isoform X1 n=1 Tax=Ostrinia furnacalis TaxID=93504 RepID=UPI00103D9C85|nr:adenylyltransferase and sulfurtransferase MOCS3 isoform X1 [Ostrinia furnacalis]
MDRITSLENEIANLRRTLQEKENELYELRKEYTLQQTNTEAFNLNPQSNANNVFKTNMGDKLTKLDIVRYSRQILLPDIGVTGQEKLCAAKVLVVGAGGLGCPAAMYLAGAGVGQIGIVDYDKVDLTNIHRQILHTEADQNDSKAVSATKSLRSINSHIKVQPYNVQLDSTNALDIASRYDVVLDCTDNVPTRYLLNDACAITKLPLISGSALKMEGQLTVYGYRALKNSNEKDQSYIGPCYRCVFPTPPPPETVGSCSANGVAGPVPGAIGCLQALEAIKLIVGQTHEKLLVERMLLFDGEDMTFRTVKLRGRNANCAGCSEQPAVSQLIDYEAFCKSQATEKKKQKSGIRKLEKEKRMNGQSYYGFRSVRESDDKRKYFQDVLKSERKIGPPCSSEFCLKKPRCCRQLDEGKRKEIFKYFWNDLDWKEKKNFVRSLVETVPPKRRRPKHKGEVSRKVDSRVYHLKINSKRKVVCRTMFLNTLGIKEPTVRCWLSSDDKPKTRKKPVKSLNVDSYIDNLPQRPPKCQYCRNSGTDIKYINIDCIKNKHQLYNQYIKDMKSQNINPASRKTFSKVIGVKNIKFFKPKNENDVCDLVSEHNVLPSINNYQTLEPDKVIDQNDISYYYNQW